MKLKSFIEKLKEIAERHGEDIDVVMADNISVVAPVFLKDYLEEKVIITDKK